MVRLLILAVLATIGAVAAPGSTPPAYAECGTLVPIDSAIQQANAVFVGEVTSLTNRNRDATMRVLEVWKGRDLPATVVVQGGSSNPTDVDPDDRTFQQGRSYLVLSEDGRSPFDSNRCTATKLYTPIGGRAIPVNLQDVVGFTIARAPLSSPGDDEAAGDVGTSILPYINIALVLVGLIAAVSFYRKLTTRGKRTPQRSARPSADAPSSDVGKQAPIGKLSRSLSLTGIFGRSGLDSSRKLRGKRRLKRVRGGRRG